MRILAVLLFCLTITILLIIGIYGRPQCEFGWVYERGSCVPEGYYKAIDFK